MSVAFKKNSRTFRKRRESFSSEEDEDKSESLHSTLEETRELQNARKRQRGVNAEDLAVGLVQKKEEKGNADPLKLKTGGYVDIKTLKKEIANVEDIEQIGTTFAAETNRRDEDADMLKYVEEELKKHKGQDQEEKKDEERKNNQRDQLYELPEHIKNITSNNKKTEDMLSNQMLSGIPEIDLGIDAKIKNIETTEEAKQQLLEERLKKNDSKVSNFVPTNMAVNFVQHNRFNIEEHKPKLMKRQPPPPKPAPLRVGDVEKPFDLQEKKQFKKPGVSEKATDDFYYEKFRKQTRKY